MSTLLLHSSALGGAVKLESAKVHAKPQEGEELDLSLVERAKAGDRIAFKSLVERYQSRALAIALGVVGNYQDAEDIAQDAFLKAYRNLPSFRGQSSFYTWLYRIVFNLSIDLSRKSYRRSETSVDDAAQLDAVAQQSLKNKQQYISKVSTPEEDLRRLEIRDRFKLALEQLSPQHRAVIVLREVDGLSYSEISDVVGCSKGTVMSRLHHARKRLQDALRELMPDENKSANISASAATAAETVDV